MGPFSWGIGLFTCCCLCFMCCPCDERQVYSEPSGRKLLQSGGPSGRYAASVVSLLLTSAPAGRDIVTPSPRGVRFFTGPRTRRRFNEMC